MADQVSPLSAVPASSNQSVSVARIASLMATAPLSPEGLNSKINANSALAEALGSDPDFRDSLFAASRLAAETAAFRAVFADADEARVAAEGSAELSVLSDLLLSSETAEETRRFFVRLAELSFIYDEDGYPTIDQESGKPISDGTVGRFIENTGALFLDHFGHVAETTQSTELAAAVETLRSAAFPERRVAGIQSMTEEKKAHIAEWTQSVVAGIDEVATSEIGEVLAYTDLPASGCIELAPKIRQRVDERVTTNPQFHREQDFLMRHNWGEKTRQARIELGRKWISRVLPSVALQLVEEVGGTFLFGQGGRQLSQTMGVQD